MLLPDPRLQPLPPLLLLLLPTLLTPDTVCPPLCQRGPSCAMSVMSACSPPPPPPYTSQLLLPALLTAATAWALLPATACRHDMLGYLVLILFAFIIAFRVTAMFGLFKFNFQKR